MKKHVPLIVTSGITILVWLFFLVCWQKVYFNIGPYENPPAIVSSPNPIPSATVAPIIPFKKIESVILPSIHSRVDLGLANVREQSPNIFAYAHGTVVADGRIFIGMADVAGNPFETNQIVIFGKGTDISRPVIVTLPAKGDVESMIFDAVNDRIYFQLSNNSSLQIYSLNPQTYAVSTIISTTTVDGGKKPAIVTDGAYIYGITNTDPSAIFKVKIIGGDLMMDFKDHIPNGHSAAIGIYGSSTELYFGGGMINGFEKADARTLRPIYATEISPCSMSDDMPFVQNSTSTGYIYVGCETVPYGLRIHTNDLSYERFYLPGSSLGLFIYGNDVYNAARDGYVDLFPKGDLGTLWRYRVENPIKPFDTKGQNLEINEIFYDRGDSKLYLTAWNGIKGLYEVATSTLDLSKL